MTDDQASGGATTVRVLFFGRVGDLFGHETRIPIPEQGCSLTALRERVGSEGGDDGGAIAAARAAIDRVVANGECWVRPGQEVAFFSPFSGG